MQKVLRHVELPEPHRWRRLQRVREGLHRGAQPGGHAWRVAVEADADRDELATRELGQLRTEAAGLRDLLSLSGGES